MIDQLRHANHASDAPPRLYAEVAVNSSFPHRQTFSYIVPTGIDVVVGSAVYVPFGKRTLQGIVKFAQSGLRPPKCI